MAQSDNKAALKNIRTRNYLARDFGGFRAVLLDYARQYYPDKIQDFSESSLGGLFLDMAAYIGDNMSFYLDHQFGELDPETAIETKNLESILRNSGIPVVGAAPAIVDLDIYIEVPVLDSVSLLIDPTLLPTVKEGSVFRSSNGTSFTLIEDVNFWEPEMDELVDVSIKLANDVEVFNGRRVNNNITSKILKKKGTCVSGNVTTLTVPLGSFVPYKKIALAHTDVTKIINVIDGYGNSYYEVESLTHDVVYKNVLNTSEKDDLVKDSLKVIPAPYRFIKTTTLNDRTTYLTLGGGSADTMEDDIIPDPSEFALPLPYSQTFSRVGINPQKMLQTNTLGIASTNTNLKITYRYGGGLDHNVGPNTIRSVSTLSMSFPENPDFGLQQKIKGTLEVTNPKPASGGEDPPTVEDLMALIPFMKHTQERVVTKEDLLARIYTMPSNFGRVFRAAVSRNPTNPLASQIHIISRNSLRQLVTSPDALKINLKRYLNSYRMISDAIDIRDASIINLEINFSVVVDPSLNKPSILQKIMMDIAKQFSVSKMQINQPIVISEITNTIFSTDGVISVDKVQVKNISNVVKNREYSPITFDVKLNTKNQIIYPPTGGIFEIRYPDINIVGKAVSNV